MAKSYHFLFTIIFLLISQKTNAQNYFPLSIGNKYQMEEAWTPSCGGSYIKQYYSVQVSDTIVRNNEVYHKYKQDYFLFDSLQQKLFIYLGGKVLAADFTLQNGEEFTSYIKGDALTFTSTGTQYSQIFGQNRICWGMMYQSNSPPYYYFYDYYFVDGIGIYDYYWEESCYFSVYWYDHRCIAAIIDSQVYNQMDLNIQLTSPIHNIALNEFPLNVSLNINMPIAALLDSLYLSYMVIRDTEVIYEDKVNFDRISYFAAINPPSSILSVGDKIKIRIVATDNTIFENRAVLPSDSGYYEIQVLPEQNSIELYPLAIGNTWIYDGIFADQAENYTYQYWRYIDSLVIKPNGEQYFQLVENNSHSPGQLVYFERIDSLSGKVFRYSADSVQSNYEYLIDDLNAQEGDTVRSYRFVTNYPYTVLSAGDTTVFQEQGEFKEYDSNYLLEYRYTLAQNFGLLSVYNYFDFGSDTKLLKGAVINGSVYGDTTLTGLKGVQQNNLEFSLSQNYPNPFNPTTSIQYTLVEDQYVTLKVFDVLGNNVASLVNEKQSAGGYSVTFNGKNLTSGIYFYQIKAGRHTVTKKCILLK